MKTEWANASPISGHPQSRLLLVVTGGPGILASMRELVNKLSNENNISQVWLELEDYQDTYCVAYEILLILSIRLGLFQLGHANLIPQAFITRLVEAELLLRDKPAKVDLELTLLWIDHICLLLRTYFNIVPDQWLIVLYGRNGPGGCAGWKENDYWDAENHEEYGDQRSPGRFAPFVKALCTVGFRVIYAPCTKTEKDNQEDKETIERLIVNFQLFHHFPMDAAVRMAPVCHPKDIMDFWFKKTTLFSGYGLVFSPRYYY